MEHLYELMFIIDPDLEEEQRKELIQRVKGEIKGEVLEVQEWEKRKLAYKINKKAEGYYVVMLFRTTGDTLKELDQFLKLQEGILRHIIIRKSKR
ncbi:30S ribosomal protein S6 [bacterium]|nr:30S ribosomal protein S6 [bacterium]